MSTNLSETQKAGIDVVVSIVNHSNPELLASCLRSLYSSIRSVSIEVWVVDNATDHKGVSEIAAEFPLTHWIFNKRRQGFAANHNQILSKTKGRYHCILNDDTIIHSGALDTLVAFLDANRGVGLVGPKTLNADGSLQMTVFRFTSVPYQIIEQFWLPPPFARLKEQKIDSAQFENNAAAVDWLLGACLIIRCETLMKIGLLDEVIAPIGNFEDVDWCRRAWAANFPVWFIPEAQITHIGGRSFWADSEIATHMRGEMARSSLKYFGKHEGLTAAALVAIIYMFSLPWNVLILFQLGLRGRLAWSLVRRHIDGSQHTARAGAEYIRAYLKRGFN